MVSQVICTCSGVIRGNLIETCGGIKLIGYIRLATAGRGEGSGSVAKVVVYFVGSSGRKHLGSVSQWGKYVFGEHLAVGQKAFGKHFAVELACAPVVYLEWRTCVLAVWRH